MLRFKPDVRIVSFGPALAEMLVAASVWSLRTRIDVEVNSIEDALPKHGATSLHRFSLAVDFDTDGDRPVDLKLLAAYLRAHLPAAFDVRVESDHVHVEFDAGWNRGIAGARP